MKLALVVLFAVGISVSVAVQPAFGNTRYIAQTAGVFSGGTACKGQRTITPATFNGIHNSPGDVNYICGTITGLAGSQLLTPKGNGSSGNPVIIRFDTGAILQAPYFAPGPNGGCGGAICLYGLRNYTVDGQRTGTIQNTANGTGLQYDKQTEAIEGYNCDGCTVESLTISNMYVHSSPSDKSADASAQRCISISGSDWLIQNNVMHDSGWCLFQNFKNGDGNVVIKRNTIYHVDHGWMLASQVAGGNSGPFTFRNNTVYGYANWDTGKADVYHHDGIHCFTSQTNGTPAHIRLLAIYDNLFKGPVGQNVTAHIFLEGGSGAGATPCSDTSSEVLLYNNVFLGDQVIYNGLVSLNTGDYTPGNGGGVFNNTFVSTNSGNGGVCFGAGGASMTFENNVLSGCDQLMSIGNHIRIAANYNQYGNSHSNAWNCDRTFIPESQFSWWRRCVKGEAKSAYHSSLKVNSTGMPQSGSPLVNAGTNLSSLCAGNRASLCFDLAGRPRPTTGAWTVGAYATSGSPPRAPSDLKSRIH